MVQFVQRLMVLSVQVENESVSGVVIVIFVNIRIIIIISSSANRQVSNIVGFVSAMATLESINRFASIISVIDNMVTWRDFSSSFNLCGCDDCFILNFFESVLFGRAFRYFSRRVTRIIVIDFFCRRAVSFYSVNIDFFLFTYRLSDAA